jgi:carbonic anhydrase/acetyltransferase-like protein (isoleucine patch superfamily)
VRSPKITTGAICFNNLFDSGSVILEGCHVNSNSIIAAGAILRPHTVVGEGEMWAGNPAKLVRKVTDAETAHLKAVS